MVGLHKPWKISEIKYLFFNIWMQKDSKSMVKDHLSGKAHASWKSLRVRIKSLFRFYCQDSCSRAGHLNQAFDLVRWYFLQDPRRLADPRIHRGLVGWSYIPEGPYVCIKCPDQSEFKLLNKISDIYTRNSHYCDQTCKFVWQITRSKIIFNPFNPKALFINLIKRVYIYVCFSLSPHVLNCSKS